MEPRYRLTSLCTQSQEESGENRKEDKHGCGRIKRGAGAYLKFKQTDLRTPLRVCVLLGISVCIFKQSKRAPFANTPLTSAAELNDLTGVGGHALVRHLSRQAHTEDDRFLAFDPRRIRTGQHLLWRTCTSSPLTNNDFGHSEV